jgi:hypothetical protein
MQQIIGIMIVIVLVCSLAFCEPQVSVKEQPQVEQPKTTTTKADPQGFAGMF